MTTSESTNKKTCVGCARTKQRNADDAVFCLHCIRRFNFEIEEENGVDYFEKSEPTTGEIVRALRCVAEAIQCKDCRYKYPVGNVILCDHEQMNGNAADRLESQENELSGITGELERFRAFHERYAEQTSKKYTDDICALTARAEQAERERDALLTDFSTIERDGLCEVCSFGDSSQISKEDCMKDCCFNYRTRRGLPQEGEESR